MHDRTVIVCSHIVPVGDVLIEVVLIARLDLVPVDGHKAVSVRAALFVPQTYSVADLVNRVSSGTAAC